MIESLLVSMQYLEQSRSPHDAEGVRRSADRYLKEDLIDKKTHAIVYDYVHRLMEEA